MNYRYHLRFFIAVSILILASMSIFANDSIQDTCSKSGGYTESWFKQRGLVLIGPQDPKDIEMKYSYTLNKETNKSEKPFGHLYTKWLTLRKHIQSGDKLFAVKNSNSGAVEGYVSYNGKCTTQQFKLDESSTLEIPFGKMEEACIFAHKNQVLRYSVKSSDNIITEIHYHIDEKKITLDEYFGDNYSGALEIKQDQLYCLTVSNFTSQMVTSEINLSLF